VIKAAEFLMILSPTLYGPKFAVGHIVHTGAYIHFTGCILTCRLSAGLSVFRYKVTSHVQIYKIYSLTQPSNKQLLLKDMLHIIFRSYMFRLVSMEPSSG